MVICMCTRMCGRLAVRANVSKHLKLVVGVRVKLSHPPHPVVLMMMQLEGDRVGIYSAQGLRLDNGFSQGN